MRRLLLKADESRRARDGASGFIDGHRQGAAALVRQCHRQEPCAYPNYYLNPVIGGGGAAWWARITKPLVREVGLERVARGVTSVELMPYHSERFAHGRLALPSQAFTLAAIRAAIARDAVIFVARGRAFWEAVVPALTGYRRAFRTQSVQNVVISERNSPSGFRAAIAELRKSVE